MIRTAEQEVGTFSREPILGWRCGLGRAAGLTGRAVHVVEAARLATRADVAEKLCVGHPAANVLVDRAQIEPTVEVPPRAGARGAERERAVVGVGKSSATASV